MTAMSGGMEKVEKKQENKDNHARWKARMCGDAMENGLNSVAFPSSSTGKAKR